MLFQFNVINKTLTCRYLACPQGWFQCKSGACIPSILTCDGKAQCFDGSDENNTACCKRLLNLNIMKCNISTSNNNNTNKNDHNNNNNSKFLRPD